MEGAFLKVLAASLALLYELLENREENVSQGTAHFCSKYNVYGMLDTSVTYI
jgi:hypothetical protein